MPRCHHTTPVAALARRSPAALSLLALLVCDPAARQATNAELAEQLGVTARTVTNAVAELTATGLVTAWRRPTHPWQDRSGRTLTPQLPETAGGGEDLEVAA